MSPPVATATASTPSASSFINDPLSYNDNNAMMLNSHDAYGNMNDNFSNSLFLMPESPNSSTSSSSSSPQSNSSMLSNNSNIDNYITNTINNSNDLFDFSLDKLSNNFYDLFHGDYNPYNNTYNGNIANNFSSFGEVDDDDDDDDLAHHEIDQELVEAINSDIISENDSENDHIVNEFGSVASTTAAATNIAYNSDPLAAIREIALSQRKNQRKHKNSTSSISSITMSSIKKVAIELQNTASSFCSSTNSGNSNAKPVVNNIRQNNNNNQLDLLSPNIDLSDVKLEDHFDENDFGDLLALDDWEQMLDEDCISRLTADFTNATNSSARNLLPIQHVNQIPINVSKTPITSSIKLITTPTANTMHKVQHFTNEQAKMTSASTPIIQTIKTSPLNTTHSTANNQIKNSSSLNVVHNASSKPVSNGPTIVSTSNVVKRLSSVTLANPAAAKPTPTSIASSRSLAVANKPSNDLILENNSSSINLTTISIKSGDQLKNKTITACNPYTGTNNPAPIAKANIQNATNTNAASGSFIDHIDIIDCVNPDQIFPYRHPRFIKSEYEFDELNVANHIDDDEEEEIDVVSINSHVQSQSTIAQASFLSNSTVNNLNSNPLSHNHHNYYHPPKKSSMPNKQSKQSAPAKTSSSSSNNENSNEEKLSQTPSLLAKCLKSSPLNNSSRINNNNNAAASISSAASSASSPTPTLVTKTISKANGPHKNTITVLQSSDELNSAKKTSSSTGNFIKTTKLNNNSSSSSNNTAGLSLTNGSLSTTTILSKNKSTVVNSNQLTNGNITLTKASSHLLAEQQQSTKPTIGHRKASNASKKAAAAAAAAAATTATTTTTTTTTSTANLASKLNTSNLNSIRILTTTSANGVRPTQPAISIANPLAPNKSVSLAQPLKLAGSNSTNSTFVLNNTISEQMNNPNSSVLTTTKYVTMTTTKISANNLKNINSTPANAPKSTIIISTTPSSNLSTTTISTNSSSVLTNSSNPLLNQPSVKPSLNFSVHQPSIKTLTTNSKWPNSTSLTQINKMNKKQQKSVANQSSESAEFYYEDDEFARRLSLTSADVTSKQQRVLAKGQIVLNSSASKSNGLASKNNSIEDLDDDDDDEDDDDDDDDDEDDDCSTSSSSSPSSLTSNTSSGCSTPTKAKKNNLMDFNGGKSNQQDNQNEMSVNDSGFDMDILNEKLSNKKIKKQKGQSSSGGSGSKRNNRLNTLGYASDNPAEKRAFHILSERQRRNDLKKLFETLRTNIPTLSDKQKASKLTILKAAVDHLAEVANKKDKLNTVFDKEKARNAQLLLHLKSLQQQQQPSLNFNHQSVLTTSASAPITRLVVH